jgi:hypothetical protein
MATCPYGCDNHADADSRCEDCNAGHAAPLQCVAVYLEDRQYGGPEEGGWWYDAGELVTDAAFYVDNLITPPMAYADPDVAAGVEVALQLLLDAGPNVGRRSTSSMLSTGRYVARVEDFPPPLGYPAEKPHYE